MISDDIKSTDRVFFAFEVGLKAAFLLKVKILAARQRTDDI